MANAVPRSIPVLLALWRLAQRGVAANVEALARESQLTPATVRKHLRALDAARLVDGEGRRPTLTLPGLALAVACSARHAKLAAALPTVMLPVVNVHTRHPSSASDTADEARL
jgi:DNA-binding IclR family transcriptional regulator